jgi:phospholipid-translocating ATPase
MSTEDMAHNTIVDVHDGTDEKTSRPISTPSSTSTKHKARTQARLAKLQERKHAAHEEKLPRRLVHANVPPKNDVYPDNQVRNTKYTWLSFLPKNFKEQFSLHINRYFLFIATLQLFRVLTPVNPITTWGPLLVIFSITAVKEGIDDRGRAKEDKIANERMYDVARDGVLVDTQSQAIRVGDIIRLKEHEEIPCDCLVLKSATPDGSLYLQTANLDGETNLKQRQCLAQTQALDEKEICSFQGVCECAAPNAKVYNFDSRLWLEPSANNDAPPSVPLSIDGAQLLQQTCSVANTEWVYALVVYTGNETKFGKNRGQPPTKYTQIDLFINKVAVLLFLFQFGLVIVFGIVGDALRFSWAKDHWYLQYSTADEWYQFAIIPLRFLLLLSTIIPISLKVTLDLCKLLYSKFINSDLAMLDVSTNEFAYAKNTSISEDLGQIEYVLTDKTGTLTRNDMVFKQCAVGTELYATQDCVPGGLLSIRIQQHSVPELSLMRNFVLNNSVVPTKQGDELIYKASSPDEIALVKAAANYGVRLLNREGAKITIDVLGTIEEYVLLEELKFNSDRKRMSVAVRNQQTGLITLFVKGADDVICARLRSGVDPSDILQKLEVFASQGLRTLMYGARELQERDFAEWREQYDKASLAIDERAAAVEAVYELLEKDFEPQGCSAIEDLLQDQVPETIQKLRDGGVRFWMLTGDKFSTALEIATSCNLRSPGDASLVCEIAGEGAEQVSAVIDQHLVAARQSEKEVVVVIRGVHLAIAMAHALEPLSELCLMAHAVICCRVTPSQKADLVHLVRAHGKMTLAIGDGGNDVAMIQQAHVGVGIRGKEGLQAARAADYNISFFSALQRLLLVHGRYSYQRTALVAQYSFYKSFLFCSIQIWFGFVSYFSGSTLFNSLCITIYNAALFVPIVTFVLDKDVSIKTVMDQPALYKSGIRSEAFTLRSMFLWNVRAFWQSIVIFLVTTLGRDIEYHNHVNGSGSDWETLGLVAFGAYLWVQAITMSLELKNLTVVNIVAIWGMHVLTFAILIFTNAFVTFDSIQSFWAVFATLEDRQFWLSNALMTVACIVPVLAWHHYRFNYRPTYADHLRFMEISKSVQVCNCDVCVCVCVCVCVVEGWWWQGERGGVGGIAFSVFSPWCLRVCFSFVHDQSRLIVCVQEASQTIHGLWCHYCMALAVHAIVHYSLLALLQTHTSMVLN